MEDGVILGISSFKPREARRPVSLSARIRADGRWGDAQIRNVSSRGMLIASTMPFARGDVIEIRRGQMCVIARVMWTKGDQFGVRSQDRICADDLISAHVSQQRHANDGTLVERRARARAECAADHQRSVAWARALQFAGVSGFAAAGAGMVALLLWEMLHSVTGAIASAL
jgi:hypothetical protein